MIIRFRYNRWFLPGIIFLALSCRKGGNNLESLPGAHVQYVSYRDFLEELNSWFEHKNVPEDVYLGAGFIAWSNNDLTTASSFLAKYFEAGGTDPEAFYLAGCLSLDKNKPGMSAGYAARAFYAGFGNYEVAALWAEALYREKKFDSALWAVNISCARYPSNPQTLALRGKILIARSDTIKGLADLRKSLTLDPRSVDGLDPMIDIYTAQGDWNTARQLVMKSFAAHNDPEWQRKLIRFDINLKNFNAADSLLNILPDSGNLSFRILSHAKIFYGGYRFDSALDYAEKELSINDRNVEALMIKGRSLISLNRLYDARGAFEQAWSVDSTDTGVKTELDRLNRRLKYINLIYRYKQDSVNRQKIAPMETHPLGNQPGH